MVLAKSSKTRGRKISSATGPMPVWTVMNTT